MAKTYSASMLKVLEGLDAVRMRPGMYIGSTGSRGLHHLLWEIVDNAIDEVANGYARSISVELHKDGSASVEDDGRGVPVDIHPELGITGSGGLSIPNCMPAESSIIRIMRIPAVCTA